MKKRFFWIVLVSYAAAVLLLGAGWLGIRYISSDTNAQVELNEAVHELGLSQAEQKKVSDVMDYMEIHKQRTDVRQMYGMMSGVCAVLLTVFFLYFYRSSVRPFIRMEAFAGELARGNLDFPLEIERSRMFGTFSWAFDHMREELKEARKKEEEALEKNRSMIAEISHDIKTPVANIRNYCEGLSLMTDAPKERRERYLRVIMRKCDEVSSMTNDLFLHALNDMDRLQVEPVPVSCRELWKRVIEPLEEQCVRVAAPACPPGNMERNVLVDERRFNEVIENILGNSRKYAPGSSIEISLQEGDGDFCITVADHGPGIPEEDILYARQKFYRGGNALNQQGAGLGLYISEVLMKQMKGTLELRNREGLEVSLYLSKTEEISRTIP